MADLQAIFEAIRTLKHEEVKELREFVEQREQQLEGVTSPAIEEDAETRIAALNAAFAKIREGLSEIELAEITEAMNTEYIDEETEPVEADQ